VTARGSKPDVAFDRSASARPCERGGIGKTNAESGASRPGRRVATGAHYPGRPELLDGVGACVLSWGTWLRRKPADARLQKWPQELGPVKLTHREVTFGAAPYRLDGLARVGHSRCPRRSGWTCQPEKPQASGRPPRLRRPLTRGFRPPPMPSTSAWPGATVEEVRGSTRSLPPDERGS
jgi:hypothetical protein